MTAGSERLNATRSREAALTGVFAAAFAVAVLLEFWVERRQPLWLDEAWTLAIAGQAAWRDFFHQVYWDVNAPLYYLLMHLWRGAFGVSDLSLRTPSLIFTLATPLAVVYGPRLGLPRADALTWAALLALWFPSLSFAQEARCYAMLLFVSTLQCMAYIRLLEAPDTGKAALWSALAAVSIVTHYDAIFPAAMQGLVYLGLYRMRAVRTWPAALAFAPAFGWFGFHLPRIVQFARPGVAWYSPLRWSNMWDVLGFMAGRREELLGLAVVAAGALTLRFAWPRDARPDGVPGHVWMAVAPSYLGAAALITLGFFRPTFAHRYLTPEAPGVLLGFVLAARGLAGRRVGLACVELIAAFAVVGGWRILAGDRMAPLSYSYEAASQALERAHPSRLVFLWDHPVDPILHPEQLAAAGDAFLHRDGLRLTVDPVVLKSGEDPNARLLADASSSGSVILWVYDVVVQGTAAIGHPPRIAELDPAWSCSQYGRGRFGVYACQRRGRSR